MDASDWANIVIAAAAVAAVFVAVLTGARSVRIAAATARRAELDHASHRADLVSDHLRTVIEELASCRGALHPYWIGAGPDGAGEPRRPTVDDEAAVHRSVYGLEGAVGVLKRSVASLAAQDVADGPVVSASAVEHVVAVADAVRRSVYPAYFVLVAKHVVTRGDPVGWYLAQLSLEVRTPAEQQLEDLVRTWLEEQHHSPADAANVTDHLVWLVLAPRLESAVDELTAAVHRATAAKVPSRGRR